MKQVKTWLGLCLISGLMVGCSKPDHVSTIKTPIAGFYYTIETHEIPGPLGSDFTRVYAHLERDGKTAKIKVLTGDYVKISKVLWIGPRENVICLDSGITDTFRNEYTVSAGGSFEKIHSHLRENCDTSPAEESRSK